MKLEDFNIVLASGSPRRIEMLERDGLSPYILKPGCGEDINTRLDPRQTVMALALRKGLAAEELFEGGGHSFAEERPLIFISADTVVCMDGKILGKPEDEEDAVRMLKAIRNGRHQVISGVFLNIKGDAPKKLLFSSSTDVFVGDYTDAWIDEYVASGEPMDKAGAYAIQGAFGVNVERIDGLYSNVVGLPCERIKQTLAEL